MRGCPEEHGFAVYGQSRASPRYPVDELVCDIVDGAQMSGQAGRGLQVSQELRCSIGQRLQGRISGVMKSPQQQIT